MQQILFLFYQYR